MPFDMLAIFSLIYKPYQMDISDLHPAIEFFTRLPQRINFSCYAKLILETAAKHGVPVEMLWKPS